MVLTLTAGSRAIDESCTGMITIIPRIPVLGNLAPKSLGGERTKAALKIIYKIFVLQLYTYVQIIVQKFVCPILSDTVSSVYINNVTKWFVRDRLLSLSSLPPSLRTSTRLRTPKWTHRALTSETPPPPRSLTTITSTISSTPGNALPSTARLLPTCLPTGPILRTATLKTRE